MSDDEIMNEIKIGAKKLNGMLDLGLTEETYIRTKGSKNKRLTQKIALINPEKLERIRNDVSFNYAATEFKFEC